MTEICGIIDPRPWAYWNLKMGRFSGTRIANANIRPTD
jgi:hypothetical protein